MFKFTVTSITDLTIVKYESNFMYSNYTDALNAGHEYLPAWEAINDDIGKINVIEFTEER